MSPAWPIALRRAGAVLHRRPSTSIRCTARAARIRPSPGPARPYPHPAVSHEPRIQQLHEDFAQLGLEAVPRPARRHARREAIRARAGASAASTCDGFPCLVQGKADAQVVCVEPALEHPNVTLLTNAYVSRLETSASGREVTAVSSSSATARTETYSADIVVVSCGAINSAALLLRSANDRHPQGLANGSDVVGRHYMGHINSVLMAISQAPESDGLSEDARASTTSISVARNGTTRWGTSRSSASSTATRSRPARPAIAPGLTLELMAKHSLDFWLTSEDLPDPDNRVTRRSRRQDRAGLQAEQRGRTQAPDRRSSKDLMKHSRCGVTDHVVPLKAFVARPFVGSASRSRAWRTRTAPSASARPEDVGARRELPGARGGQSLRRGRQLLPVERRRESGAHDHGERAARRRPPLERMKLSWTRTGVSRGLVALVLLAAVCCGHRRVPSLLATAPLRLVGSRARRRCRPSRSPTLDRPLEFYYEGPHVREGLGRRGPAATTSSISTASSASAMRIVAHATRRRVRSSSPSTSRREGGRSRSTRGATTDGSSTSRSSSATWTARTLGCDEYHVEHASPWPQRLPDWNPNAGGIRAFYFKDPDGHPLEILCVPAGQGRAEVAPAVGQALSRHRPHRDRGRRTPTRASRFYRDALGLAVAGESENYGTEQERLNNVFGARLADHRTPRADRLGIELLEYLAPRDGRAFPADERSNDIVHRETEILVDDAGAAGARLRLARAPFISSGVVDLHDGCSTSAARSSRATPTAMPSSSSRTEESRMNRSMQNAEQRRLDESRMHAKHWKRWGPYLSERAWGTVREDYSRARSRLGLLPARPRAVDAPIGGTRTASAGISRPAPAHLLRPRAVERARSDPEGAAVRPDRQRGQPRRGRQGVLLLPRHHADALVHGFLYKYPQAEFPYARLVEENRRRGEADAEFELADTGVFDDGRYFDVVVEYAKADAEDILVRITVDEPRPGSGADSTAADDLVPQHLVVAGRAPTKPRLARAASTEPGVEAVALEHRQVRPTLASLAERRGPELLFTENETNVARLLRRRERIARVQGRDRRVRREAASRRGELRRPMAQRPPRTIARIVAPGESFTHPCCG